MGLIRMAWRNIRRNRRRMIVTLAAMTLAPWVMIHYTGVLEGCFVRKERNILILQPDDVRVFAEAGPGNDRDSMTNGGLSTSGSGVYPKTASRTENGTW